MQSPDRMVKQAADFLLSELKKQQTVAYSLFYDGTDECHERVLAGIGLEDDWYSPEHLIDNAVLQLEEQGIVRSTQLCSKLADGESDYRIEWTRDGQSLLAGRELQFRDME